MTYQQAKTLVFTVLLFCISPMAHAQTAVARILVYGTHQGDNIIYHYKVINSGNVALHDFVIGSKFHPKMNDEVPQLQRLPIGWEYGQRGETGTEILLSPSSTSQPTNWTSQLFSREGASGSYYLQWETTSADNSYGIPAGQTLSGFSVTVPLIDSRLSPRDYYNAGQAAGDDDDIYLTGNFKVRTWDAQKNDIQNYWGKLEIEDTTAPTLSVTLDPDVLHQNGKYVPITATIKTNDDFDPQPVVKLLSITSNEPMDKDDIKARLYTDDRHFQLKAEHDGKGHAGRIYTVTYFVTDGSGNQAEASAAVTVRHDRKEHEDRRDDKDNKYDKDGHKRDR